MFRKCLEQIKGAKASGMFGAGHSHARGESGSAIVEFALSASIVLCMLFAIIEFGFALYAYQYVNEVTRDLSRYAIVRGGACGYGMPGCGFSTSSALQTYGQQTYAYPGINPNNLTVSATWYCPSTLGVNPTWTANPTQGTCTIGSVVLPFNGPGTMIQVSAQYPFLLSIPFWKATTLQVTSTSSMVISQ